MSNKIIGICTGIGCTLMTWGVVYYYAVEGLYYAVGGI